MLSSPTKSSVLLLEMDFGRRKSSFPFGKTSHLYILRLPPWPSAQLLEPESATQIQGGCGVGFSKGKREE